MVSETSEGLWIIVTKVMPYFLPSFAIRSMAILDELYLTASLLRTYLWASS